MTAVEEGRGLSAVRHHPLAAYSSHAGCRDTSASNFDALANTHDPSKCSYPIPGCTDSNANNYVSAATQLDSSCKYLILGCMTASALNYDSLATQAGVCREPEEGCMDNTASNYNKFATYQNTTVCLHLISGCTQALSLNLNSLANVDDGTCVEAIPGCMDSLAGNYDVANNIDDPSNPCFYYVEGCTSSFALNYDTLATIDTQSACKFPSATNGYKGCDDSTYIEYNPLTAVNPTIPSAANYSVGYCLTKSIAGCTQPTAANYNSNATVFDGSCVDPPLSGCTVRDDINYNPTAVVTDLTACSGQKTGCTDSHSLCYNPVAVQDDGSCYNEGCKGVYGCTDSAATNYNPDASKQRSFSDCAYPPTVGCNNPLATNYNPSAIGCDVSNPRCCTGFTRGCSDSRFANYDPDVDNDDGSCYKVGCTIGYATNFDPLATDPKGITAQNPAICTLPIVGCMQPEAPNYSPAAEYEGPDAPGFPQCKFPGCMDSKAPNFDPTATTIASGALGGCDVIIGGCMNSNAPNYLPAANVDNAQCELSGCMIPGANNYRAWAETPTLCSMSGVGCTDSFAVNYVSSATSAAVKVDYCPASILGPNPPNYCDRSCQRVGCTDSTFWSYDPLATVYERTSCLIKLPGCTDNVSPNVMNFRATANFNDGTCRYGGCTDSIRFGYDPTATDQFHFPGNETHLYKDDTWIYCGGFYVPPAAPPPPPVSEFAVTFGTAESCISMFAVFQCDYKYLLQLKFVTFMITLGTHQWSMDEMLSASIPCPTDVAPYTTCTGRRLELADGTEHQLADGTEHRQLQEAIDFDLRMFVPPGMSDAEFTAQLLSVDNAAWSAAFGITITGLIVCVIDEDTGEKVCAFPPPPSPPPPQADDDDLPPWLIAIIVVVVLLFVGLVAGGIFWYRRKQARVKATTVTPDVAERAVVQPPALPAAPPPLPGSAGAPAATSLE